MLIVDWTPTPAGSLDLCKLSDAVFEINMECIDRSNVGGLAGFNAVFGSAGLGVFLQYDCANLDLSSYEQCWAVTISGTFWAGGKGTPKCDRAIGSKSFPQWPAKEVTDFCKSGFTKFKYATGQKGASTGRPFNNKTWPFQKKCDTPHSVDIV